MSMLLNWFPMLLLIGVRIFFMRSTQSGSGRAMGSQVVRQASDRVPRPA